MNRISTEELLWKVGKYIVMASFGILLVLALFLLSTGTLDGLIWGLVLLFIGEPMIGGTGYSLLYKDDSDAEE